MGKTREESPSRRKPGAVHQPALAADPQSESPLFGRLPQELRDKICSALFFSTRFSSGEKVGRNGIVKIRPAPNALSILQTCRRAKTEIGDSWIGQVLFDFNSPKAMLDKLSALPPGVLSKVRHLRVYGRPLVLFLENGQDVNYRLVSILKLLPDLRLDVLTVLGDSVMEISYHTLNGLITEACGWKELRYINHNSAVLGFGRYNLRLGCDPYRRKPQPGHWQSVLEDKDGAVSKPSVVIYRSTVSHRPGSVMNPKTRAVFKQKMPEDTAGQEDFGLTEDARLMADGEMEKEMMVIVKRGHDVDYEQKKDSPFIDIDDDIRRDMPGKTWKQIRRGGIYGIFTANDDDDCQPRYGRNYGRPTEIDVYEEVDEYAWTPLYLMSGS